MDTHELVWQVLGAWALDACDDDETRLVAAHLIECPPCHQEAGRLRRTADVLGVLGELSPQPGARGRLLSAALAKRPAATPDLRRLVGGYREQIGQLGSLLDSLDSAGWAAPVPRHGNVRDLITHLSGNDHALLTALGGEATGRELASGEAASGEAAGGELAGAEAAGGEAAGPLGWRWQAHRLAERLGTTRLIMRSEPVALAGPAGLRRPVRDAVVQRIFETWVHADDVRVALDLPRREPGEQAITHIIDLGVGLLPVVLSAIGRGHPGKAGVLKLTGLGAGIWTVPLSSTSDGDEVPVGEVVAELAAEAVDFCRLMAGRLAPGALRCVESGEPAPLADLLYGASRLGCDPDG
jgi:uncharacterized protein (TIGR03083 family)